MSRHRGDGEPALPDTGDPGPEGPPPANDEVIVRAVGLRKRYTLGKDNYVDALRGASIDVLSGEMVAIMGPSGSGKSTLMHLLGCLDSPDSGEVWLGGRRVNEAEGGELNAIRRREVGFVFQGFNLIPTLTAVENVALAAEYAGSTRAEALEAARQRLHDIGLADRMDHLPSELSGGQQQRVAIARALVNDARIVLGDEPTGDLDTASSEEIISMMRQVNRGTGTTFVLVTHNPEIGQVCDRIVRMRDGVVSEES